jgi:hypothetical protein
MKRIQCESCQKIWYVDDVDLVKQKVCPFCDTNIQGILKISQYDTLDKLIFGAISNLGKDVLHNPRQLLGYMMDTAPALKREIRIFIKTITDSSADYILTALEQEEGEAIETLNKLHYLLLEEEGLAREWADILCGRLFEAISYIKKVDASSLIKVKVDDYSTTQQEKKESKSPEAKENKVNVYEKLKEEFTETRDNLLKAKRRISFISNSFSDPQMAVDAAKKNFEDIEAECEELEKNGRIEEVEFYEVLKLAYILYLTINNYSYELLEMIQSEIDDLLDQIHNLRQGLISEYSLEKMESTKQELTIIQREQLFLHNEIEGVKKYFYHMEHAIKDDMMNLIVQGVRDNN